MRIFLSHEDTTIEVKVPGPYQPDVLSDMCNRANESHAPTAVRRACA